MSPKAGKDKERHSLPIPRKGIQSPELIRWMVNCQRYYLRSKGYKISHLNFINLSYLYLFVPASFVLKCFAFLSVISQWSWGKTSFLSSFPTLTSLLKILDNVNVGLFLYSVLLHWCNSLFFCLILHCLDYWALQWVRSQGRGNPASSFP